MSSLEGTPAATVHSEAIWDSATGGKAVFPGRTRKMCHWLLRARRGTVEMDVGRMTQRRGLLWIMGAIPWSRRDLKKPGMVVRGLRLMMYI